MVLYNKNRDNKNRVNPDATHERRTGSARVTPGYPAPEEEDVMQEGQAGEGSTIGTGERRSSIEINAKVVEDIFEREIAEGLSKRGPTLSNISQMDDEPTGLEPAPDESFGTRSPAYSSRGPSPARSDTSPKSDAPRDASTVDSLASEYAHADSPASFSTTFSNTVGVMLSSATGLVIQSGLTRLSALPPHLQRHQRHKNIGKVSTPPLTTTSPAPDVVIPGVVEQNEHRGPSPVASNATTTRLRRSERGTGGSRKEWRWR